MRIGAIAAAAVLSWAVPAAGAGSGVSVVSPPSNLLDGQVVSISGPGWGPLSDVVITEIHIHPKTGGSDIALGRTTLARTDRDGKLATTYAIARIVGGKDCARLPGSDRCALSITAADHSQTNTESIVLAPK